MQSVGATLVKLIATATSGLVSFTTNVIRPVKVTCKFSPVREGTGNPSPDNVRPISGWTGCEITHFADNLVSQYLHANVNTSGKVISHNVYDIAIAEVKAGEKYVISGVSSDSNVGVYSFFRSAPAIGSTTYNSSCTIYSIAEINIITAPIDGWIAVRTLKNDRNAVIAFAESLPITVTNPNTGDPMTAYGGTLTLNEDGSVDLIVNKLKRTYIGSSSEQWSKYGSGSASAFAMRHPLSNFTNTDGAIIADYLVTINRNASWGNYDNWVSWAYPNELITGIKSITTVAAWKTYLAENPLTIVYNLKSSLSYHLDNVGQLQSFLGTNNVWHDMNGSITAEYWNKQ